MLDAAVGGLCVGWEWWCGYVWEREVYEEKERESE